MDLQVTDVPDEQRFEIRADGELAGVVVYHMRGSQIAFLHTETEDQFRGHGVASRLIRSSLDAARERNLSVLPYCPYVQRWLAEHPDYVDLVPEDRRSAFGLLRLRTPVIAIPMSFRARPRLTIDGRRSAHGDSRWTRRCRLRATRRSARPSRATSRRSPR
jgi:uncharacterized protein